jgi:phage terminase large subunit-like protein
MFKDACDMREQSPKLRERIVTSGQSPIWQLTYLPTASIFKPISAETKTTGKSGPRPHFALCDEIHEHRNRDIVDLLEAGFKWRQQPLLVMITNSGSDRASFCWEQHEHAIKVAAGDKDDDDTFSYVCALDPGDDPLTDPRCWIKANPLLGVTITEEYLTGVAAQARAIAGKANLILRLHFCVWTDSDTAWLERSAWEAIEEPSRIGEILCGGDVARVDRGALGRDVLRLVVAVPLVVLKRIGRQRRRTRQRRRPCRAHARLRCSIRRSAAASSAARLPWAT